MIPITINFSKDHYDTLQRLSKEHCRTLSQEITYRIDQSLKLKKHVSEDDVGLFKVIAEMYRQRASGDHSEFEWKPVNHGE
jgi:hypothetical protein